MFLSSWMSRPTVFKICSSCWIQGMHRELSSGGTCRPAIIMEPVSFPLRMAIRNFINGRIKKAPRSLSQDTKSGRRRHITPDFWESALITNGSMTRCRIIDECGTGSLCGDVYVCAYMAPKEWMLEGLNDSKQLSEKKRNFLYPSLIKNNSYSVQFDHPNTAKIPKMFKNNLHG